MRNLRTALIVVVLTGLAAGAVRAARADPVLAGWLEDAWLGSPGVHLEAKLDTGADSSSIDAPDYAAFTRDGGAWVRFRLIATDGVAIDIVRPVVRVARIRRAGAPDTERPVITLDLCVAGQRAEAEFTLADRAAMRHPVLIGRAFLAGRIVVDPGRSFLASDRCGPR